MPISFLHAEARRLAANGVPVFPCHPDTKVPACDHGFHDATTDLEQIDRWWTEEPNLNIARCPHQTREAVIDIDGPEGEAAWEAWQAEHGYLPLTHTIRTPRGGLHYYFRGVLPPTQSKLGVHVDTRGVGSYALVPPSTVGGKPYTVEDARAPADLPDTVNDYLRGLAKDRVRAAVEELDLPQNIARARKTLADYLDRGKVAVSGSMGNLTTYQVACDLCNLGCSGETALELMRGEWNDACLPPWEESELEIIVQNAARYSQNEPGAWGVEASADTFKAALDKLDLSEPEASANQPKEDPYRLWTISELRKRPPPTWLLPDILPDKGTSVLYGLPGTFKSFLAVYWACQLASLGVAVVYVAGEDVTGIRQRIDGWCMANDLMDAELPLWVVENSPRAAMADTCKAFAETARSVQPSLIVIDTLAWASVGLNENDAKDMMILLDEMGKVRRGLDCAMLIVHHSGKDGDRGPRGSGALTAGADAVFEVRRPNEAQPVIAAYCKRQKNAELRPEPWCFEARKLGALAVLQPVSTAEFHSRTATSPKIDPRVLGKTLRGLGAVGEEAGVSTPVLALELAKGSANTPDEQDAAKAGFLLGLGRGAGGVLGAYCSGDAAGRKWFVPA